MRTREARDDAPHVLFIVAKQEIPQQQYDALEPLLAIQTIAQARTLYLTEVLDYNRWQLRLYTVLGLADTARAIDQLPGVRSADDDARQATGTADSAPIPPTESLRAAADLINAGKKVAILVGRGALGCAAEVGQLAEKTAAPVAKAPATPKTPKKPARAPRKSRSSSTKKDA